jgi:hypothetical protein
MWMGANPQLPKNRLEKEENKTAMKSQKRVNGNSSPPVAPVTSNGNSHAKGNGRAANGNGHEPLTMATRARITLVMSQALDDSIEIYCLATSRKKTEVVMTALTEFLQRNHVDPFLDRRAQLQKLVFDPPVQDPAHQ